ncbi:protein obstructor-E-like isoform X2 [Nymphalis io]|uniref:protein obstructor-E-like isoform X2 n=1 Tax=Inachis io TaxID=171585 RepID=UPI00216878B6|nr:protein obstructor-E-like isoform X2 [Nymphalis io]
MKTIIVSFSCICLFAFVQTQNFNQTSTSISNVITFINEWIRGTKELNKLNLPFIIIIFEDKDGSKLASTNKDSEKNNNVEVNIKENVTKSERMNTEKLINLSSKNETSQKTCTEKHERYPIPDSCDSYIECKNGIAEKKLCPDGLRYKHDTTINPPCLYPTEVQCNPGSTLQPPKPTENCPNQNGYFKTEDRYNCSSYRICVNGVGYDYNCPFGLAFNSLTYRCDWPDTVPQCDAEGLFSFRCPEQHHSSTSLNTIRSYRSPKSCEKYYTCINGKPRRLECNEYFAFDEANQICVPAFNVTECSEDQKYLARRYIRQNSNGEYVRNVKYDDDYFNSRAAVINFSPRMKRPRII